MSLITEDIFTDNLNNEDIDELELDLHKDEIEDEQEV